MDMIFTIGIFTSIFFFVLLLNKKNKSLPDKLLSAWMLVIGIHLSSTYANVEGYWDIYPHLIGITAPFPLLYGLLLYLYVTYSIKNIQQLSKRGYVHFLPFAIAYLYMSRFFFFYSTEEKRMVDQGQVDDFGMFSNVLVIAIIVSAIGYAIVSYRLLDKHRALVENNFSNPEQINLNWLKGIIWGVVLIFVTVTVVLVSRDILGINYPFNPDFVFYSMIVFAILGLGYFGIRHENIFTDNVVIDSNERLKLSYQKSSLKGDVANEKHTALKELMSEQKPYLDSKLNLNMLADELDLPLHHLSQIINQFEGQNFNDFVNKYRVEEFVERASKDSHFSFLALALDSGFNSKSTFNSVFRKHKGVTPSQYMSTHSSEAS